MTVPVYQDVVKAHSRIREQAIHTPLMRSMELDRICGAQVFIKPENLQHTGSFKIRGAYNAINAMTPDQRDKGILAVSSGNHAQGIALAAKLHGAKATILMPSDAPENKVAKTKAFGAEVIFFNRATDNRTTLAADLIQITGGVFIHPYNNEYVIAGQGTIGLEIAKDMNDLGLTPDRMLLCTGGGGLTSGVCLALSHHYEKMKFHSCEPVDFDDYKRSLEAKEILQNEKSSGSICDAIITPSPGNLGFEICLPRLDEGLVISDDEAMAAVKFAYEELKLVVEPGGAVALGALLKQGERWKGEIILIILSGGNIDPSVLNQAIGQSA